MTFKILKYLRPDHTERGWIQKQKKTKNNQEKSKKNISHIKEKFHFRVRFHSVWTFPYAQLILVKCKANWYTDKKSR